MSNMGSSVPLWPSRAHKAMSTDLPLVGGVAALQRGTLAPGADDHPAVQRLGRAAAARLENDLAGSILQEELDEDGRSRAQAIRGRPRSAGGVRDGPHNDSAASFCRRVPSRRHQVQRSRAFSTDAFASCASFRRWLARPGR